MRPAGPDRDNDLLGHVDIGPRCEPPAVGIKPTNGQFLGDLGHFRWGGLVDLEPHQVSGLGYEARVGIDEPGTPRFLLLIKARTISRGEAVAGAMEDFRTEAFAAAALMVDLGDLLFRFVILGSPEKPKGPR